MGFILWLLDRRIMANQRADPQFFRAMLPGENLCMGLLAARRSAKRKAAPEVVQPLPKIMVVFFYCKKRND
jgi:hypothetical protein